MAVTSYDFVVVGAGTAGSVVAARLSERPDARVLLLEAGPVDGPAAASVPAAWPSLIGSVIDWGYRTVAQPGLAGAVVPFPLGKVLGGSSAINGMIHLRGHPSGYDAWAADGAAGWGYDALLPYFRRSEKTLGFDERYRGTDGPMTPMRAATIHPAALAVIKAFEQCGHPLAADLNGPEHEGAACTELNVVEGARQSAADAYLRPILGRPTLTVLTGAHVHWLLFSGQRCTGVEYAVDGELRRAEAAGEVILCAGAIGSPHLLQRSGIGPADALRTHGIDVVADLPGVGGNLADHPLGVVVYAAARPMTPRLNNHAEAVAAIRTHPRLVAPDLQLLFIDIPFPPDPSGPQDGFTIAFSLMRPRSRGSVTLASNDPDAAPLIDLGMLTDERDMSAMLAGLRVAREVGGSPALAEWREQELLPGPAVQTPEQERGYVRRSTTTYFHPVGTCRIGTDTRAVTDLELRVRRIDGLRVADASVMPSPPTANTNATVLAIAERAAAIIVGDEHVQRSPAMPQRGQNPFR